MESFSPAQIERFKRDAKAVHRELSIPHSQALDRLAIDNGYKNWSLLMKRSDILGTPHLKRARRSHQFSRTTEFMRLALLKVPEPRQWRSLPRRELAQREVADLSQVFVSPQNAVEFANDYMNCLLTVPRFKLNSAAPAYWEMRSWLPYSNQSIGGGRHILVNRDYKPVGQVGKEWANYEEFPHLHVDVTDDQSKSFTAQGSSDGYLFNDGCSPWDSRADAVAYLERLKILLRVLKA